MATFNVIDVIFLTNTSRILLLVKMSSHIRPTSGKLDYFIVVYDVCWVCRAMDHRNIMFRSLPYFEMQIYDCSNHLSNALLGFCCIWSSKTNSIQWFNFFLAIISLLSSEAYWKLILLFWCVILRHMSKDISVTVIIILQTYNIWQYWLTMRLYLAQLSSAKSFVVEST